MGFRPMIHIDSTLIKFESGKNDSYEKHLKNIEDVLKRTFVCQSQIIGLLSSVTAAVVYFCCNSIQNVHVYCTAFTSISFFLHSFVSCTE